jgi:hypothetical protein
MLPIPSDILTSFEKILQKRKVPARLHIHYRKWLRYFLDFCQKYPPPESKSEQVNLFIGKLRSKKQNPELCRQAAHAVSLYFEIQQQSSKNIHSTLVETKPASRSSQSKHRSQKTWEAKNVSSPEYGAPLVKGVKLMPPDTRPAATQPAARSTGGKRFKEWRCLEKTKSPAWDQAIDQLAAEIKTRNYSKKTLKTYADWARKFQGFLRNKSPQELSSADVKEYLTHLAVKCRVAASTQNQAFNLFRVNSPQLAALPYWVLKGFDTPLLAAG